MIRISLVLCVLLLSFSAQAGDVDSSHMSIYSGQENRTIKSLSTDDIAELKRGDGWGQAKAAELNGVPGPKHLLQMKNEIGLDETQYSAINEVYHQMKSQAVLQGERLIALEQHLGSGFRNRTITDVMLRKTLNGIAETKSELRYVHLAAHLRMLEVLSEEQIRTYNELRGYPLSDPCANIPAGHDSKMWRDHNGCS